jgi:hypothetical protein
MILIDLKFLFDLIKYIMIEKLNMEQYKPLFKILLPVSTTGV